MQCVMRNSQQFMLQILHILLNWIDCARKVLICTLSFKDTGRGKKYLLKDKTLISFRAKKRELTDEQKKQAAERMRKYQASKSN